MSDANEKNAIDQYILQFPQETQDRLNSLRKAIRDAAPDAAEKISWRMPTFFQNGNLIHFAAHKNHIGIYPGSEAIEVFRDRLLDYATSKGAIQLPNDKPLPMDLIHELVRFRVAANTK